jgi:tetratricopeptide (TPR) repeat protein
MMWRFSILVVPVVLVAVGCGRDDAVASAASLERGIAALQRGDDEAALAACRQAASLSPQDSTAQECLMVAAVRRQNWELANQAAARLLQVQGHDPWLVSVANQIGRRADPTVETALPLDSPQSAWACLESPCRMVPPGDNAQMVWLASLVQAHQGDTRAAIAALGEVPAGSQAEDLLMMLLLREQDFPALRQRLADSPCTEDNRHLRQALRNAIAPDLPLSPQCLVGGAEVPAGGSVPLNLALTEMAAGRYDAARAYLRVAQELAPDAQLPIVYEYLLALLSGDERAAAAAASRFPPDLPASWQTWLAKVPQRPVL